MRDFIVPIVESNEGMDLSNDENKKQLIQEISDEIGIKTDPDKIEKSVTREFKKIRSELADISLSAKTTEEIVEERKIADEKMVEDLDIIKRKVIETVKL